MGKRKPNAEVSKLERSNRGLRGALKRKGRKHG